MKKIEIDNQLRVIRWQFAVRVYTPSTTVHAHWFGKYWTHIKSPLGSFCIGFFKTGVDLPKFMKIGFLEKQS
jgi:hypothetical protein